MSVVNEALRNLQKRRTQVAAERKQEEGNSAFSQKSALSLAVVQSWVHQPIDKDVLNLSRKNQILLLTMTSMVLGLVVWNIFSAHSVNATDSLKVQLSAQFSAQEHSPTSENLTALNHLAQLSIPVLPEKIMQVKSTKKTSHRSIAHTAISFPEQRVIRAKYISIKPIYQVRDDLDHAEDLAQDRGYNAAQLFLSQLVSQYPKQPDYAEALIKLMIQNKHWDQAVPIVKTARLNFPSDDGFKLLEARYYVDQQQWDKANEILKVDPNLSQVEYLSLFAMIKKEIKDTSGANELYLRLRRLEPENPAWQLGLGLTYESMGQLEAAYTAYIAAQNSTGLSAESYTFIRQKLSNLRR